ncbi:2OG-Fe dioxygenase family protein [bacterium]|nr:2OG-Fe dioxygenase family protein [bacterium]
MTDEPPKGVLMKPIFLKDEKSIGEKLKRNIVHPIRLFRLRDLGVDQKKFIRELAPTFSVLAWDYYDVRKKQIDFLLACYPDERQSLEEFRALYYAEKTPLEEVGRLIAKLSRADRWAFERIKPHRKRSFRQFLLTLKKREWDIRKLHATVFSQNAYAEKGDFRAMKRRFNRMSDLVADNREFRVFLKCIAEIVRDIRPDARKLLIKTHQTSIFADADSTGDNAPEGIHQDGADYIVSALVVERDGITGGESIIYGDPAGKHVYFKKILQLGEGIFQADKDSPLWHDVTPIYENPDTSPAYGKRSTFGLDISITKEM